MHFVNKTSCGLYFHRSNIFYFVFFLLHKMCIRLFYLQSNIHMCVQCSCAFRMQWHSIHFGKLNFTIFNWLSSSYCTFVSKRIDEFTVSSLVFYAELNYYYYIFESICHPGNSVSFPEFNSRRFALNFCLIWKSNP